MPARAAAPPPPQAALRLWRELVGRSGAFAPGTTIVVRNTRYVCPAGWIGVVRLGDALAIDATVADDGTLTTLLDLDDPSDPEQVAASVNPLETLGPGMLAYLPDGADLDTRRVAETLHRAAGGGGTSQPVPEAGGGVGVGWLGVCHPSAGGGGVGCAGVALMIGPAGGAGGSVGIPGAGGAGGGSAVGVAPSPGIAAYPTPPASALSGPRR